MPGQQVEVHASYVADQQVGAAGGAGGSFADHFSGTLIAPTTVRLDTPIDGLFTPDGVEIVGQDNDQAAIFNGEIIYFNSILTSQGETGDRDGRIVEGLHLPDGSVIYVGQSAGLFVTDEPTYWFGPNSAMLPLAVGKEDSGELRAIAENGTFVGTSGFVTAAYGDPESNSLTKFPGFDAFVAQDISRDAQFVAGDAFLWTLNDLGGYSVISTADFDFAQTDVPSWFGVETDAQGNPYFSGSYLSLETFTPQVGFWNLEGDFLGGFEGVFADFAVSDGEVIAAFNGFDDGHLIRMSDGESLSMTELIGQQAFFPKKGLFTADGVLGLLLQDENGSFYTVLSTEGGGGEEPLPIIVDLHVDYDGDGIIDAIIEGNQGSVNAVFNSTGTYTAWVYAIDSQTGVEVARASQEIVVAPWQVVTIDGEEVLIVGANQQRGSTITVNQLGGGLNVTVDRDRGFVEADRVEIWGSDRNDRVTLRGGFDAALDLGAGNDTVTAIGVNVNANFGAGNDRLTAIGGNVDAVFSAGNNSATVIGGGRVSLIGGSGADSFTSIGHDRAFIDGGAGNDSILSSGRASVVVGGSGRDRITVLDTYSLVITDELVYSPAAVDTIFAELAAPRPDVDYLASQLAPLVVEDDDVDTGLQLSLNSALLSGNKDRIINPFSRLRR